MHLHVTKRPRLCAALLVMLVLFSVAVVAGKGHAQDQRRFNSPAEAVQALVGAFRANDSAALMAVFGPDGKELIFSGDEAVDREEHEWFLKAYEERHFLCPRSKDRTFLEIGPDDWRFPVPVVQKDGTWYFDTAAGKEEVLNRRIGRNELNAIEVCRASVEAQREYLSVDWDEDGVMEYAQRISSHEGMRDGLYWPAGEGGPESPFGPLAAKATMEWPGTKEGGRLPYYGYYFKVLRAQGKDAPGGAYSYLINGNMVAGFALVAWPSAYRSSGIMTFIVNQTGIVYEKDLGPNTAESVKAMKEYNPDKTWKRAR